MTLAQAPAMAQQTDTVIPRTPEVAGQRISIAVRQNMLAESLAKSACYAYADVQRDRNLADLYVNWNIYFWYHRALLAGNYQLGLFAETDPRVRRKWVAVDRTLGPLSRVYRTIIYDDLVTRAELESIFALTDRIVEENGDLVAFMRSAYAGDIGSTGTFSAILIELYERSRKLANQMSKLACMLELGIEPAASRAQFTTAMNFFIASIGGFIDGLPALGVPPAPTPEIRAQLTKARGDWDRVSAIATRISEGRNVDRADLDRLRVELDNFTGDMNLAVTMLIQLKAREL